MYVGGGGGIEGGAEGREACRDAGREGGRQCSLCSTFFCSITRHQVAAPTLSPFVSIQARLSTAPCPASTTIFWVHSVMLPRHFLLGFPVLLHSFTLPAGPSHFLQASLHHCARLSGDIKTTGVFRCFFNNLSHDMDDRCAE